MGDEISGTWWLPDTPTQQVSGILRLAQHAPARLDYVGALDDVRPHPYRSPIDVIHGATTGSGFGSGEITLVGCMPGEAWTATATDVTTQTLTAQQVFQGHYFESGDNIRLDSLILTIHNLADWVFTTSTFQVDEDERWVELSPPPPPSRTADIGQVTVQMRVLAPAVSPPFFAKRVTFDRGCSLVLRRISRLAYDELQRLVGQITSLVTFGKGGAATAATLHGEIGTTEGRVLIGIHDPTITHPRPASEVVPHDMLFTYKDIVLGWERIVPRWCWLCEELEHVINLYLDTIRVHDMGHVHAFLNLVHAVESYHRLRYRGLYQDQQTYDDTVVPVLNAAIPSSLDKGHRDALRTRIKFGNEHALRKRLEHMMQRFSPNMPTMFAGRESVFVDRVVDTRNYLTHYTEELRPKARISPKELDVLSIGLEFLLDASLLSELEFSAPDRAARLSVKWNRYRFAMIEHLTSDSKTTPKQRVSLRTASATELRDEVGLNRVVAQTLVERREAGHLRDWDDVAEVTGVGPRTLEKLRRLTSLQRERGTEDPLIA